MAEDVRTLFGIKFSKKNKKVDEDAPSFAPSVNNDGAIVVETGPSGIGGHFRSISTLDLAGIIKSEIALIQKYRRLAMHHEADQAIDDIINEAIVQLNETQETVSINLDDVELSENLKKSIITEFDEVLDLLDFETKAYEIFKSWYVDGRLVYHKIPNEKNNSKGLVKLKQIDPTTIKKIKEVRKEPHPKNSMTTIRREGEEYFVYNEAGVTGGVANEGVKIDKEAVTYVHSGLTDDSRQFIVGHLHKAIKPHNQLRMIEDAAVIYRISRAPERRVFFIDVGNLPTTKAEQYVKNVMDRHKNKLVFDASTGELHSDRKNMHIMEDFYLPRREGGKGTEVTTLPGGQNLGEIEDIRYFQRLFYKSLNVPVTRIEPEIQAGLGLSRATEITRDELKFMKFVRRLQRRFSILFLDILRTQLLLKNVLTQKDWDKISKDINFIFAEDSQFTEAIEIENLRERLNIVRDMDDFVGKYFSKDHIRKFVLRQDEETIKQIDKEIEQEKDQDTNDSDDDFGL